MNGYKTYALSLLSIAWAIYGVLSGHLDQGTATQLISTGAIAAALRHGIANS